ncbi:sulfotransferase [Stutzerimonas stutzeri]|uniref:sulfotransferase n=1 Tax=Stutzerimonas stutzeri TaxID=316 RepID=UPI001CFEA5D8|nr:sulfotransferase [Stutzerimonas stutzeri]
MENLKLLVLNGAFSELRSLLCQGGILEPASLKEISALLFNKSKKLEGGREWEAAAEAYALYVDFFATRDAFLAFNSLLHCLRQASRFEDANKWEIKLYNNFSYSVGGHWFDSILAEESLSAVWRFFEMLLVGRKHSAAAEQWLNLFLAVRRAMSGETFPPLTISSEEHTCSPRKIFVAGFERSGTGAIRAYFNEYPDVYEVPGSEIQIISGANGLAGFLACVDKESVVRFFIRFLKVHGFGLGDIRSSLDWKEISRARIIISEVDSLRYCKAFSRLFVGLLAAQDVSAIADACARFMDDFLLSFGKSDNTVFFFNNIVNCRSVCNMQVVGNYFYIPVLRDPRDQYASTVQTRRPELTGEAFVHAFQKTRRMYEGGLQKIDRDNVFEVQYEDFVRDEGVRVALAEAAGLLGRSHNKYEFFKPWDSESNIGIYRSCNAAHVKHVYSRLKSFCVEV